ncbi:hypothetical protein NC77_21895 [Janthinobacterium lividum]|uniref:AAA family ATPase n=1 Tax=Janthinobacterium lividum TaxID=29581 RepID=UPI000538FA77|nr:AAA family ATPase [Janthinobacterium lividum]KHA76766.1 hypothetical protein NC77_21895 [Janthinobacterium lividum]
MKNKIESLHLRGMRQFHEVDVHFNAGFNFIAGPNGCGKTSILAGISHCFNTNFQYSRFSENVEFWVDLEANNRNFRIGIGEGAFSRFSYRDTQLYKWVHPPVAENRESLIIADVPNRPELLIPLFIGAQRRIKYSKIQGLKREEGLQNQIDMYISNATKSLHGEWQADVKQWFINRYFIIEKEWGKEEAANWQHMIEMLPHVGPFDSDFRYITIGKELEPVFSIYGKKCYLEELSAGFQAVLLIIANIIEWIEASRKDGDRNVKEATGTVLIDELDIHLHPEWQFNIRNGLSRIFPNIQFIVTTHSPHLLSSADANEVIVMPARLQTNEKLVLRPSNRSYAGWSTDQILSDVMGVRSLDNKVHEKLVAKALDCIDTKNVEGLRTAIAELKEVCHPNDTMLVVLTTRLAGLEALADD